MTNNTISLDGLKGGHPLGFMAALGLLRCLTESASFRLEFGVPRLCWQEGSDWTAVLHTQAPADSEKLIDFLLEWVKQRGTSIEFNWAEKISSEPRYFTKKAQEFANRITPTNRSTADFFAAFSCELITSNGKLRRTALDMTDANQGLMKNVRELMDSLAKDKKGRASGREAFRQALFGPWKYEDGEHAIGWDPSTESLYALRANDPTATKNQKKRSVRAAVYLAAEALPFFPCAPTGSRLSTRGFIETRRKENDKIKEEIFFSWPVWRDPLCLEELRSLLGLKALTCLPPPLKELRTMGIVEVFRSHKVKTGGDQGNRYIFSTAHPCTEVTE